jgi:hypothetical protein
LGTVTIDTGDIIAVRRAGLQALNAALGEDGTKAFLKQWSGAGHDIVKERKALNLTNEEIMAGIMKLQAENI